MFIANFLHNMCWDTVVSHMHPHTINILQIFTIYIVGAIITIEYNLLRNFYSFKCVGFFNKEWNRHRWNRLLGNLRRILPLLCWQLCQFLNWLANVLFSGHWWVIRLNLLYHFNTSSNTRTKLFEFVKFFLFFWNVSINCFQLGFKIGEILLKVHINKCLLNNPTINKKKSQPPYSWQ